VRVSGLSPEETNFSVVSAASIQGFHYILSSRECVSTAAALLLANPNPYTPGRPVRDRYNRDGCLVSTEPEGLLELDDADVVSSGVALPLEIFRTADGRGWGVKCTDTDILMGQFVCEYVGETLTDAEARPRTPQRTHNDTHRRTHKRTPSQ
jgi:hypothetical protein